MSATIEALAAKLLEQETSAEMLKIRQLIMLRMALEGEVRASRIPAPANITEVGGYYNLLAKQKEKALQRQAVSSALGLPNDYAPDVTEELIKKLLLELLTQKG